MRTELGCKAVGQLGRASCCCSTSLDRPLLVVEGTIQEAPALAGIEMMVVWLHAAYCTWPGVEVGLGGVFAVEAVVGASVKKRYD